MLYVCNCLSDVGISLRTRGLGKVNWHLPNLLVHDKVIELHSSPYACVDL